MAPSGSETLSRRPLLAPTPLKWGAASSIALAFEDRALDMVLGDEGLDGRDQAWRHRHGLDQIVAGLGEGLALGGIRRDRLRLVGGFGVPRASHNPPRGRAG